jgi:hypothetical protein
LRTAFYSHVTADPDMSAILAQVEGAAGVFCIAISCGLYIIGCHCHNRSPWEFTSDCAQTLLDAERVKLLLEDVELEFD